MLFFTCNTNRLWTNSISISSYHFETLNKIFATLHSNSFNPKSTNPPISATSPRQIP